MSCPGLIPFMTARLDEEAAAAKSAHPGPWDYETEIGGFGPVGCVLMPLGSHKDAQTGLTAFMPLGTQDADTAAHIARYDPPRALREIEAKRARLVMFDWALTEMDRLLADDDAEKIDQGAAIGRCEAARTAVKHDAAVYSDHPDYRKEWAP